jgi:hypothetical protein
VCVPGRALGETTAPGSDRACVEPIDSDVAEAVLLLATVLRF